MPNAYIGSTEVVWTNNLPDLPVGSALFIQKFHANFESGKNIGQSLVLTKNSMWNYESEYQNRIIGGAVYSIRTAMLKDDSIGKINQQTAMSFQLYGDPLLTKEDLINAKNPKCGDKLG
jgi:hypothetical protein